MDTATESPSRSLNTPGVRFLLGFGFSFGILYWLLRGNGPASALNDAVGALTLVQTRVAGVLLGILGEPVKQQANTLFGGEFTCAVDTGCNGMTAVTLLAAGFVAFPVPWRSRLAGFVVLLPAVLAVNVVRIAGLYWTGVHHAAWFGPAHVYVGQVLVILATTALWLAWLSWTSRPRAAS